MQRVRFAPRVGAHYVLLAIAATLISFSAPSVATAATASYSSIAPKSGSSSLQSTPTITVTVYAAAGVKGSGNYGMYLDGVKVKPSIKYLLTRYRKFRLTYRRTTPLAPGVHKVKIKVTDRKHHSSSRTWTFTVLAPPPPPVPTDMALTIESNSCTTCHAGYPTRHPMTACALCHGPSRPVSGVAFGPRSVSAHTTTCAASSCHQPTTGAFPHVLSADCGSCHTGRYPGIPLDHGPASDEDHLSSSVQCTLAGCHEASLTMEHLRYAPDGAPFTCETCHTSSDPRVVQALRAGDTACTSCHGALSPHPAIGAAHTLTVNGCLAGGGCHVSSDASTLHGGACADCHAAGRTPSTVCATCHAAEPHPGLDARHAAGPLGCTAIGCHPTDVRLLHASGPNAPGCAACHAPGKPALTLTCATPGCHPAASTSHAGHPVTLASQTISIGGTGFGVHACSECHALDLIALHEAECSTCHASVMATTIGGGCVPAGCHAKGSARAQHAGVDAAHAVTTATTCVAVDCHTGGTNVAAIHAGRCAICHKAGSALTVTCDTGGCHSTSDPHPVKNPHPGLSTIHATGLPSTCAKPGCHLAELAALHSAAQGCSTCHGAGKTPTAACAMAGCHGDEVAAPALHPHFDSAHITSAAGCSAAGCHSADAIAIHTTGEKRPGCAACHASGKSGLTMVCATSGCHPGDVDSAVLHPAYALGHVAPQDGCTKSGCHDVNVITIHTTGAKQPGCPACHASGKPELTLDCETEGCHKLVPPPHLGHPVTPSPEAVAIGGRDFGVHSCAECHVPLDLVDLHDGQCATCHARPLAGVTLEGGCRQATCHASGATAQHADIDAVHTLSSASCSGQGCHDGGANVAALHETVGCVVCHAAGAAPTLVCSTDGCHGPRDAHPATAPHPNMSAAHVNGLPATCVKSGCHESDLTALHAAKQGCATCHWQAKPASATCVQPGCHNAGVSSLHASHPASAAPASIRINGLNLGTFACSTCHASMDLQVIHARAGGCDTCHPGAASAVGDWDGGCAQAACHGAGSAHPMHRDVNANHTMTAQPKCTTTGCHQGNSTVGGRDFALMHFPTAAGCANCHTAGHTHLADCADCHEQWATQDHQADHKSCNDCHAPYAWDPVTSTANKGAQDILGDKTAPHWDLFDAPWTLSIGRAVIRPGYPYGDYTMLRFPPALGTPGPYSSTYFERTATYSCSACHTGAGKTWVHPASDHFTCGSSGDCHEHHSNWDPAQGSASYVHNTPPASWTATMRW